MGAHSYLHSKYVWNRKKNFARSQATHEQKKNFFYPIFTVIGIGNHGGFMPGCLSVSLNFMYSDYLLTEIVFFLQQQHVSRLWLTYKCVHIIIFSLHVLWPKGRTCIGHGHERIIGRLKYKHTYFFYSINKSSHAMQTTINVRIFNKNRRAKKNYTYM